MALTDETQESQDRHTPRTRGNTRGRLVAAAERVLTEQGYDAATVKEIGRAAGVAPGLVHYYFADKDALLAEVLREASERHLAEMSGLAAAQPPRELLAAALAERKRRVNETPEWYRMRYDLFALGLRNRALLPGVAVLLANGRLGIGNIVRKISGGQVPNPEAVAAVFLAALDGLGLQKLADPSFDLDEAYRVLAHLAGTLLAEA